LRAELIQRGKNPKQRLHIGIEINNNWEKTIEPVFFSSNLRFVDETKSGLAFQIPIGYTYRATNGFYLDTGLEYSTQSSLVSLSIGCGISFGK